jgi:hypothetical protein
MESPEERGTLREFQFFIFSRSLPPPLSAGSNGSDARVKTDSQRIILVMFLGGCTFSEISALRFLGREKGKEGFILGFWKVVVLEMYQCANVGNSRSLERRASNQRVAGSNPNADRENVEGVS